MWETSVSYLLVHASDDTKLIIEFQELRRTFIAELYLEGLADNLKI